ncbi:hypothetical protein AAFF_G00267080 [Aldrovandia affinis]|uniref:Uncharacterized protein n=1 Tax=Aldrovandia affinis TaxID=143900 RepID=A0AAD7W1Q7_9TELE|nr:hypothetical protein AAFF_G00267080 [Aldrovandia affinis]
MADTPLTDPPSSGGDFDMMGALDWKDGIATLPGSDIRFRMTEFGTLEIVTEETFCSAACVQPSSGRLTLGDQRERGRGTPVPALEGERGRGTPVPALEGERGRVTPVPALEGERLGKRVRRKRKMYMDSGDDEDENPEEEEEKSKACKGRRAAKLARLVTAPPPRKKAWSWPTYLEEERAVAAPLKLFKEHQAVPQGRNAFKVGMKMEGLDPCHPSLFCVLSVAEIQGYRTRLHFDGYPECYDFWVNADTWDVKPAGWCEKTGNKLLLPKGCKDGEFNWSTYVKNCRGQIAPKHLFKSLNTAVTPSGFRVGMKLEAVDRKNPSLICVASIAAAVDNRLLIHFDNWDDTYDYWCDASSPYIHPIGFCEEAELTLTTPAEYKHPKSFSWERYLEETGAQAAPARAFKQRPAHGFQVGMKVEVVDKRNPMLIRVASIADLEEHRLKVHFDGWSGEYDYWLDADSPDLHPVGWCQKTGHPLQNPQGSPDPSLLGQGCPTPGCTGVGHVRGPRYGTHYTAVSCPYSEVNLNKEGLVPDRLSGARPRPRWAPPRPTPRTSPAHPHHPDQPDASEDSPQSRSGEGERSDRSSTQSLSHCGEEPTGGAGEHSHNGTKPKKAGQIPKCLKLHLVKQETGEGAVLALSLQQALHESVFCPSGGSSPTQRIQLCWDKHCKLLPEVLGLTAKREWPAGAPTRWPASSEAYQAAKTTLSPSGMSRLMERPSCSSHKRTLLRS